MFYTGDGMARLWIALLLIRALSCGVSRGLEVGENKLLFSVSDR